MLRYTHLRTHAKTHEHLTQVKKDMNQGSWRLFAPCIPLPSPSDSLATAQAGSRQLQRWQLLERESNGGLWCKHAK